MLSGYVASGITLGFQSLMNWDGCGSPSKSGNTHSGLEIVSGGHQIRRVGYFLSSLNGKHALWELRTPAAVRRGRTSGLKHLEQWDSFVMFPFFHGSFLSEQIYVPGFVQGETSALSYEAGLEG